MNLEYKSSAVKQLKKLPKVEQKKVVRVLERLASTWDAGKKLKGELEDFYALRAWPYRIIYTRKSSTITIYSVTHRQGAYK